MRIIFSIISFVLFAGSIAAQKVNLGGSTLNPNNGKVYLQKYVNKSFHTIDSAAVVNGQFKFAQRSDLKLPEIYGLSYNSSTANPFDSYIIFLDDGNVNVQLDSVAQFRNTKVTGSREHALFEQLLGQRKQILSLIQENPQSLAALYILYRYYSYRVSSEELRNILSYVDEKYKDTEYVQVLEELASTLEKVGIGEHVPDFVAYDQAGKEVKSSSLVGNSYVLFDFWASWCPPCRAENPNLVKAYAKYKNKGLSIVSISLDNNVERWQSAYTNDGLSWLQLIDRKAWAGDGVVKFGIRLIPANFLISPEGKIIAHNLKGDDLEQFLKELLEQ